MFVCRQTYGLKKRPNAVCRVKMPMAVRLLVGVREATTNKAVEITVSWDWNVMVQTRRTRLLRQEHELRSNRCVLNFPFYSRTTRSFQNPGCGCLFFVRLYLVISAICCIEVASGNHGRHLWFRLLSHLNCINWKLMLNTVKNAV